MRITTIIIRVLVGLLFIMASVTYFFNLVEVPPAEGAVKTFNDGLAAAVYLMPLVKTLELLCGILFVGKICCTYSHCNSPNYDQHLLIPRLSGT